MVPTRPPSPVAESFHHCRHPQQRHPFYAEAFLLCAWPECSQGTLRSSIDVTVGASLTASRTELAVFERQEQPGGGEPKFRWSRRWPR